MFERIRASLRQAQRGNISSMAFWAWLADALGLKFTRNWFLMRIGCKAAQKFENGEALSTLERLARLRAAGVLSEAEFQRLKVQFLGSTDDARGSQNRR